jgi:hypothetical protein
VCETRRLAKQAAKRAIQARGEKVTDYKLVEIAIMAETMVTPALIEQAKANVARWFGIR